MDKDMLSKTNVGLAVIGIVILLVAFLIDFLLEYFFGIRLDSPY